MESTSWPIYELVDFWKTFVLVYVELPHVTESCVAIKMKQLESEQLSVTSTNLFYQIYQMSST